MTCRVDDLLKGEYITVLYKRCIEATDDDFVLFLQGGVVGADQSLRPAGSRKRIRNRCIIFLGGYSILLLGYWLAIEGIK